MTPGIEGVTIRPLRRIDDARGAVLHMLRADDPWFAGFGEIYFSAVHAGAVKAWRRHRRLTSNVAVPAGSVRLVLVDGRAGSPDAGRRLEVVLGEDAYALVTIPPGVWAGWEGLGPGTALVANCATGPHDPAEVERADAASLAQAPGEGPR
ncbi:MAG: dTDP-4-dehydrorhamnose 3,5-epimerase family protein [Vicinamibacterales bacterium]